MTVYVLYLFFHRYLSCLIFTGFIFYIVIFGWFFMVAALNINKTVVISAFINVCYSTFGGDEIYVVVKTAPNANPSRLR